MGIWITKLLAFKATINFVFLQFVSYTERCISCSKSVPLSVCLSLSLLHAGRLLCQNDSRYTVMPSSLEYHYSPWLCSFLVVSYIANFQREHLDRRRWMRGKGTIVAYGSEWVSEWVSNFLTARQHTRQSSALVYGSNPFQYNWTVAYNNNNNNNKKKKKKKSRNIHQQKTLTLTLNPNPKG